MKIERRPDSKDGEELQPQGVRRFSNFSEWEISFTRHLITSGARRYLYGEGPIISRKCAADCLERINQSKLAFAVLYLGYDPRPPRVS